jgi:subtilisin family serine protease
MKKELGLIRKSLILFLMASLILGILGTIAINGFSENDDLIIAMVDTGTDMSIAELNNKDIEGYDFYNDDLTTYDDYLYDYHGTSLSYIIISIEEKVKILPVKFMEGSSGDIEDAIKAIDFAIKKGSKIINCSWNYNKADERLEKIIKEHPEVLFVCSAGNSCTNLDIEKSYPCCYEYDNIISVMACKEDYSPYETSGYGKKSVDIAAVGENVYVALPENDHDYASGSSVATAHICGVVAKIWREDISKPAKDVKQQLLKSANKSENLLNYCLAGGFID